MSTNSVVAIPQGDGWRGRYVHSDGYPSWMGKTLFGLVKRDGLAKVAQTLISDHYGWSNLDIRDGKEISNYLDERGEVVAGYGLAYTDTVVPSMGVGYQQVTEDEWITSEDPEYWAYVLAPHALIVIADGKHVAEVPWSSEPTDETWSHAEALADAV